MKKLVPLLSSVALSLVVGGTVVSADVGPYDSDSNVSFTADDTLGPVTPVDPMDPATPVTPVGPINPVGGPLSIDYASSFRFGTQKITTVDEEYFAQLQEFSNRDAGPGPNYVQVTDRRGTLGGWSIYLTQADTFQTAQGEELAGAELTLRNTTVDSEVDETYWATVDATQPFTLVPGAASKLATAATGKGAGTYVIRFGDDTSEGGTDTASESISLTVPGRAVKLAKEYTTVLNWTLTDVPGN